MVVTPEFRISANQADITDAIAARFVRMRLSDDTGYQSDLLEVTLADNDPAQPIQIPPKGAELEVWLGYDGDLVNKGLYVCDEIELAGWPGTMTIRARAAVYDQTPKGKTDLQSQKVRDWPDGTKLADMVAKIAKEHGMQPAVSASLKSVVLPHQSQTEESDVSFLVRIAKQYDAVVKPSGGKLVVAKRAEGTSISGEDLPTITLDATECTSFRMTQATREKPGTVVAYWHSTAKAKRQEVSVGSGDPVKRLRHHYPTESAAKAAAQGELDKRTRKQSTVSVSMPGNPRAMAEAKLVLAGFRDGVDGDWLITRVDHDLDAAAGYVCHVDGEKPKDEE